MYLSNNRNFLNAILITLIIFSTVSCSEERRTSVTNFQPNKPFVYKTAVIINGNISKDEKKRLTFDLDNYWDDSLKAPKLQKAVFWYTLKNPPVFDSANILRSKKYMNSYLNSQGFYYADFKDSVLSFDTFHHRSLITKIIHPNKIIPQQIRTTVFMKVDIGKNITIDSVGFVMLDSNMQRLAIQEEKKSFLSKGSHYTKQTVSDELDRLVNMYRQNGYFHFTRDDIYAEADTLNNNLLQLSVDAFAQGRLLEAAAHNRKMDPKWNILIKQKATKDSSKTQTYHIAKTYYYPEAKITDIPDSLMVKKDWKEYVSKNQQNIMRYTEGKFSYRPLREHTFLRHDSLYNEDLLIQSINTLGQIGAWQQVDTRTVIRNKDSIDLYFFLVPALKQNFTVDLEGSRNTGDLAGGDNFLGISTNFTYRNRNVWKNAIQSVTNLRLGTELGFDSSNKFSPQSFLIGLSQTYIFPKLIQPFTQWRAINKLNNKKTLLSIAGSYTDRKDYYRLRQFTGSWGYEWNKINKSKNPWNWTFRPLNVELYKVDTLSGFLSLLAANPFLQQSFRDGKVVGTTLSVNKIFNSKLHPTISNKVNVYFEESGTVISIFSNTNSDQIFRYVKLQAEYTFNKKFRKTAIAARIFSGITVPKAGQTVPFYKQYFLGGPNSMRAWGLRQLGLGSSILSDTSKSTFTDRYGDFALEGNFEYRFPIWTFSSFKVSSALFTDIGNVWNLSKDPNNANADFNVNRLGKDIAVAVGTGIRFDFNYFLIRIDAGYKVKDPARQYNNGWMSFNNFWSDTRSNGKQVNNASLQFGIGLPF